MKKPFVAEIPAETFALAQKFAAKNDIRYYLNTVCIRPCAGGATLNATNGHIAIVALVSGTCCKELLVPLIPSTFLKRGRFVRVNDDGSIIVGDGYGVIHFVHPQKLIDNATFPNILGIIEKAEWHPGIGDGNFGTSYLRMISELPGGVSLFSSGKQCCAVLDDNVFSLRRGTMALLMGRTVAKVTPMEAMEMMK